MPPLLRRRLDPLGRMVAQVVYWCARDQPGLPIVFATRYADATRSLTLFADLARDEPLSPTGFSHSVHNAIGAMVSIARRDTANMIVVAAGASSAAAALIEAYGLLVDGEREALVVCYDAPLPDAYRCFADERHCSYAWAWRVSLPEAGEARFSVRWHAVPGDLPDGTQELPFGLETLRFTLSGESSWDRRAGGTCWQWRFHG